jgi:glycine cleavage system aminomethyltransferase T
MSMTQTALARTPLHNWHTRHGARFVERDGWLVVDSYADTDAKPVGNRRGLVLVDLGSYAKVSVVGNGVMAAIEVLFGQGQPVEPLRVVPFDIPCAGLACRLAEDHLLLLPNGPSPSPLIERLAQAGCAPRDLTCAFAGFAVGGPEIDSLLCSLTALDPLALSSGSCAETNLAGVHAVLVRPQDATRLHVYVAWDFGEYVWERLIQGRSGQSVRPIGSPAWEVLADRGKQA